MPSSSPEVPASIPSGDVAPGRPPAEGPSGLLVGPVPVSPWDSRTCAQGWDYVWSQRGKFTPRVIFDDSAPGDYSKVYYTVILRSL